MLPWENFVISHAVNGYFSAFSTFFRQTLLKHLTQWLLLSRGRGSWVRGGGVEIGGVKKGGVEKGGVGVEG